MILFAQPPPTELVCCWPCAQSDKTLVSLGIRMISCVVLQYSLLSKRAHTQLSTCPGLRFLKSLIPAEISASPRLTLSDVIALLVI